MYTKLSDTKAIIELEGITFLLDATSVNFELIGIPADEEMIAEELSRASIHANMIADFEDELNVQRFEQLLIENSSTAYSIYNA
jgi:hypothetical protein